MKIKALTRFNNRDAGEVFEVKEADAKKWIGGGYAAKAGKKDMDGPDKDKVGKKDQAVTK